MPSATGSVATAASPGRMPPIATPAEKNANSGTATPAENGRNRCSKTSASPGPASGSPLALSCRTGMVKPSTTPAMVAWMPEAWSRAQATTPMGSRMSQAAAGLIAWTPPRLKPLSRGPRSIS